MASAPFSYPFQVFTAGGRLEGKYGPGMGCLLGYDYRVRGDGERRRVVIERNLFLGDQDAAGGALQGDSGGDVRLHRACGLVRHRRVGGSVSWGEVSDRASAAAW